MAVTAVTTTMAGAINYTVVTDTSADWTSVANSTYFYDKADKLVHYKDSTGVIQEIFSGSGITVGTTAVTSGTDGRVFFQAGGVVQQDANFTYDSTLKRLTLKAVGTAATDIPLLISNSAGTVNLLQQNGVGSILARSNDTFSYAGLFYRSDSANGWSLTNSHLGYGQGTGIETVNTTSYILSGGVRALSINTVAGGTYKSYGIFNWGSANGPRLTIGENTSDPQLSLSGTGNLGIGTYTAGARLDVRAQGALSTDIAFRVRNSADTSNVIDVQGNGITTLTNPDALGVGINNLQLRVKDVLGNTASFGCGTAGTYIRPYLNFRVNLSSTDVMILNSTSGLITTDDLVGSRITYLTSNYRVASGLADVTISNNQVCLFSSTGVNIGRTSTTSGNGGTNILEIKNGTIPSLNVTDTFQQYSADIVAGNAAPHFRTENGSIIKLYQETTGVSAATLVSNAGTALTSTDTFDGYTMQQVIKALKNLGILQ